jgi:phosphate:Na+ symporter
MITEVLIILFELLGSLAVFIYGMEIASEGIQRAAGNRLQKALNFMTKNTFFAIMTGTLVTMLVQSSSAITVMTVSFVNAGLLNLIQAIGVIMGSNIGTTFTAWIVAAVGKFSISALAIPLFGIGFGMSMWKKRSDAFRSYGKTLIGFALIFIGLDFLAKAVPPPSGETLEFLRHFKDMGPLTVILSMLAGLVFTLLIHTSSGTSAVVIALALNGVIDFRMAAAMIIGANIGTTIDSFLVSLGSQLNAKRAAWSHILFNVFGSIWVMLIFEPFIWFIQWITPGELDASSIGFHIAVTHSVFNIANTLLLAPFTKHYANLVSKLIRGKPEKERPYSFAYTVKSLSPNPDLNLIYARKEVSDMAGLASQMFAKFTRAISDPPPSLQETLEDFKSMEAYADQMREELTAFLYDCLSQNPSESGREEIMSMMRMTVELETVTDDCYRLMILLDKGRAKKQTLDAVAVEDLKPYTDLVGESLSFVEAHIGGSVTPDQLKVAEDMENRIDLFKSQLKKTSRKRMQSGAEVKTELMFLDIIRHIEKIGDHAFAVSNVLREMA